MEGSYAMVLAIEVDRATDGRWLAEVIELPGVISRESRRTCDQAPPRRGGASLHQRLKNFERTTTSCAEACGTVNANGKLGGPVVIKTYDVDACGETQYFDCTFGCSINTNCPNGCIEM